MPDSTSWGPPGRGEYPPGVHVDAHVDAVRGWVGGSPGGRPRVGGSWSEGLLSHSSLRNRHAPRRWFRAWQVVFVGDRDALQLRPRPRSINRSASVSVQ